MKKYLLFILCIAFSSSIFAQGVPQGIPFQGVARDLNGTPIAEKEIKIRINLLSADADGQILYQEFHKVTTNQLGLFDLVVGQGRATEAEFKMVAEMKAAIEKDHKLLEGILGKREQWGDGKRT